MKCFVTMFLILPLCLCCKAPCSFSQRCSLSSIHKVYYYYYYKIELYAGRASCFSCLPFKGGMSHMVMNDLVFLRYLDCIGEF